ncbi:hypothetical protein [Flindersiella endophytica]
MTEDHAHDRMLHAVGERSPDLAVGLFGPRAVVKVMAEEGKRIAGRGTRGSIQFVSASHTELSEAAERYVRLAGRIDAAVFPGPMHYDLAREAGYLSVPASYVKLSGAALYSTLLRGRLHDDLDITRLSIDSLSQAAVEESYAEIGVPTEGVHCEPYTDPSSALGFAGFHRRLLRSGAVTTALTTIFSVEQSLRAEGLPVLRIQPTRATVREALETAVLLGRGTKLEDQQIAMIAVQLLTEGSPAGASTYWQQDAALSVHRILLEEARTVGATVVRRGDTRFGITTTYGGLDTLTSHLQHAPFVTAARRQLGVPLAVGLGAGHTPRNADANALAGLESALERRGEVAVYVDESEAELLLSTEAPEVVAQPADGDLARAAAVLERILAASPGLTDAQPAVVDVEEVSAALGVTDRTGRRMLKQLVEAGLAWPLPPQPSPGGGRPRQRFRLLPGRMPGPPESLSG